MPAQTFQTSRDWIRRNVDDEKDGLLRTLFDVDHASITLRSDPWSFVLVATEVVSGIIYEFFKVFTSSINSSIFLDKKITVSCNAPSSNSVVVSFC